MRRGTSKEDLISWKKSPPKGMGIYDRGVYDPSEKGGHGMRKKQGLTNYIEFMEAAEKAGMFPHGEHLK